MSQFVCESVSTSCAGSEQRKERSEVSELKRDLAEQLLISSPPFLLSLRLSYSARELSNTMSLFTRPSSLLSSFSRLSLSSSPRPSILPSPTSNALFQPSQLLQVRNKSLVPRRTKYRKAHKGRIDIASGGSTKGTMLEWGDYGLRVNEPVRLSAKHLEVAEAALKRGLKPIRGSKVFVSFLFFLPPTQC
jgi:hypothetical protein